MHILKGYYPNVYRDIKNIRYVVGKIEEPIEFEDDEKVIFAGSCTSWEGEIDGQHVKIESSYRPPTEVDEKKTKPNDMLKRNLLRILVLFKNRKSRYIHLPGCPLSVGDHVHYLSGLGKVGNPNFDSRMIKDVNVAYFKMRSFRFMNRLFG